MKIKVGTVTKKMEDRDTEIEVELPDEAVVASLEFVYPYVIVQYWKPA